MGNQHQTKHVSIDEHGHHSGGALVVSEERTQIDAVRGIVFYELV
jgi:hypothetical protein